MVQPTPIFVIQRLPGCLPYPFRKPVSPRNHRGNQARYAFNGDHDDVDNRRKRQGATIQGRHPSGVFNARTATCSHGLAPIADGSNVGQRNGTIYSGWRSKRKIGCATAASLLTSRAASRGGTFGTVAPHPRTRGWGFAKGPPPQGKKTATSLTCSNNSARRRLPAPSR